MKEALPTVIDKVEVSNVAPVKKEQKFIGTLKPHKGHRCYELNIKTGEFGEAEFDTEAVVYGTQHVKRKLVTKENCIYCTALNEKNALKHFRKMLATYAR